MTWFRPLTRGVLVALCLAGGTLDCRAAGPVAFDRQVRPILSDKCFQCHGPDAETRAADLRLDTAAGLQSGVLVAGEPEQSELVRRIASSDPTERMPPPDSGLALTTAEIETVRQWVAEGAAGGSHWAFAPLPASVPLPSAGNGWAVSPLDRFVAATHARHGLQPSAPAEPLRWLRRVALDLTGLPPDAEAIAEFERDVQQHGIEPAAERAVDRLLASPAFGEHLAVGWLDAARYADSYGYQSDQLNTQWPYRDWVVRALNDNLPYDQFLTWQIAGDLLPGATRDQVLATAFNRLHRMTNEGGSIPAEWRLENAADRVNVFGTVMLGLTLECARCHDHKFDPITARNYFSLLAFFNSIDEHGLYDHPAKVPAPSQLLPSSEQEQALADAQARVAAAGCELAAAVAEGESRFTAWLAGAPMPAIADCVGQFDFEGNLTQLIDHSPAAAPPVVATGLVATPSPRGQGALVDGDLGIAFPERLAVDRCDPWSIDLWLRDAEANPEPVVLLQRTFGTDVGYNGTDVMLAGGHVTVRIYRVWPGNAMAVRSVEPLTENEWQHLSVTYDGSSRAAGIRVYLAGRPVTTKVIRDHAYKSAAIHTYGDGVFRLGARFRDRGFAGGAVDELQLFARQLTELEVAELHTPGALADAIAGGDSAALRDYYFAAIDAPTRATRTKLTAARREAIGVEEGFAEVAVMRELPRPRPTHLLARGAYDAPRDATTRVDRDVPTAILPPLPTDQPRDRLALARWATQPDHPLTARVFVNRLWINFFGLGLVDTPENFGSQGGLPSHPELLDWLARDFVDHGWDIKRFCRQVVLSATYRQDSRVSADARSQDPGNRWLARGPSFRLSAEQLRDQALAASGLLEPKRGGPPVSPYQPGGDLWREVNEMSPAYQQSVGTALHRRSLYSVWKRTAPLPNMLAFDATTREVCTVNRSRTSTPLQALVLLNDVQFVEAARSLAESLGQEPFATAIEQAMLRVTGRRPLPQELEILERLYREQHESFSSMEPEELTKFLAIGESAAAPDNPVELAALTVVCQTILNLDAAIMRR